MKKKIQWMELVKLPAISTIINNRKSLTIEDIDHLRLLAIQQEEKIKKSILSAEAKIEALEECQEYLNFCEARFSRVVDCETLEITGESQMSGDADYKETENIKQMG